MDTGYTDKHRLKYKYRFRFGARKAKTSTATVTVTATATTKAKATVTRSRCSPMYVRTRTGCGWLLTTGTRADRYECRCSEPTTAHTARHSNARGLQCVAVGASETTLLANTCELLAPKRTLHAAATATATATPFEPCYWWWWCVSSLPASLSFQCALSALRLSRRESQHWKCSRKELPIRASRSLDFCSLSRFLRLFIDRCDFYYGASQTKESKNGMEIPTINYFLFSRFPSLRGSVGFGTAHLFWLPALFVYIPTRRSA